MRIIKSHFFCTCLHPLKRLMFVVFKKMVVRCGVGVVALDVVVFSVIILTKYAYVPMKQFTDALNL